MVNCAHPTHFAAVLEPMRRGRARIGGIRANASTMSHAELDDATELDAGDPAELAERYRELRSPHSQPPRARRLLRDQPRATSTPSPLPASPVPAPDPRPSIWASSVSPADLVVLGFGFRD